MRAPSWLPFFREINWQSAKIYQHIARWSDKLRRRGNQLRPCRRARRPLPYPRLPLPPRPPPLCGAWERLGGSNVMHLFIYLSRSFISRYKWPWRLTTTESPSAPSPPPPHTHTHIHTTAHSDKTAMWGWGGGVRGDYHKKHTNQEATMNGVTGRRRW